MNFRDTVGGTLGIVGLLLNTIFLAYGVFNGVRPLVGSATIGLIASAVTLLEAFRHE
jgi:hypothetical protein